MKVKLNGNDFYEVTSLFGSIDSVHKTPHTGLDLAMNTGTQLFSPVDGVVKKIVDYGSENVGKGIFIETDDHRTVIMGHLSDFKVTEGQRVHEGDLVALSGNTGHSTGSHLHLGLKDSDGSFISPNELVTSDSAFMNDHAGIATKLLSKNQAQDVGFMDGARSMGDFLHRWHDSGSFWIAMYDKPFFEVVKDFFAQLGHDVLKWVLGNGDMFFILPAIILMFGTFLVGKNKYSKFIIPLWFAYFISTVLNYLIP
jgi:hypothetical protein